MPKSENRLAQSGKIAILEVEGKGKNGKAARSVCGRRGSEQAQLRLQPGPAPVYRFGERLRSAPSDRSVSLLGLCVLRTATLFLRVRHETGFRILGNRFGIPFGCSVSVVKIEIAKKIEGLPNRGIMSVSENGPSFRNPVNP